MKTISGATKPCSGKLKPVSSGQSKMRVITGECTGVHKDPVSPSPPLRAKYALMSGEASRRRNKKTSKYEKNPIIQISLYQTCPHKTDEKDVQKDFWAECHPVKEVWLGNKHGIYDTSH